MKTNITTSLNEFLNENNNSSETYKIRVDVLFEGFEEVCFKFKLTFSGNNTTREEIEKAIKDKFSAFNNIVKYDIIYIILTYLKDKN